MPNVLIRDVPSYDLEELRSAAIDHGMSLQSYLLDALRTQAAHLRRRAALRRTAERLAGRPGVPEEERAAALEAVGDAHAERGDQLSDPSTR